MTIVMSREEHERMLKKSGLMAPSGFHDAKTVRDHAAEPLQPEPPKPAPPAQTPAPAPVAATPATPEPTGPVDHLTVADLAEEIRSTAVRVMQAMPEKFRGPQGIPGPAGQSVSAEALRKVIAEEIERAIASQPDRFRGQPGHSVTLDDTKKLVAEAVHQTIAADPERFRGLKGDPSTVPGPVGPAGKTVIVERNIIERGPKGDPGRDSTVPGPAGLSKDDIVALVCGILQDANAIDQNTMRVVATTMALEEIATSDRYHRLGIIRDEIVSKIRKALC